MTECNVLERLCWLLCVVFPILLTWNSLQIRTVSDLFVVDTAPMAAVTSSSITTTLKA